jgi:hypothetical protein
MNNPLRKTLLLALALLLSGCAAWTHLTEPTRLSGPDGLSFMAPADWVRFNMAGDRAVALTRDGMGIQLVRVEYRKHDKAFPQIKKTSSPDLLPSEAAELAIADLRSDKSLADMKILENVPARVAGRPGFRVHGQYRDARGASFDLVVVGAPTSDGLLLLFYRGLTIHYYGRDIKQFDQIVSSVELGKH